MLGGWWWSSFLGSLKYAFSGAEGVVYSNTNRPYKLKVVGRNNPQSKRLEALGPRTGTEGGVMSLEGPAWVEDFQSCIYILGTLRVLYEST